MSNDTKAFLCQDLRRLSSTEIKGFEDPLKSRFDRQQMTRLGS